MNRKKANVCIKHVWENSIAFMKFRQLYYCNTYWCSTDKRIKREDGER